VMFRLSGMPFGKCHFGMLPTPNMRDELIALK